jgi:hypothetical protein
VTYSVCIRMTPPQTEPAQSLPAPNQLASRLTILPLRLRFLPDKARHDLTRVSP